MSTTDEKLREFLKEGQAWEKKLTSIQGVFLLKLPHIQRYFSIPCCRSKSCKSIWFSHKEKRSNNKIELRARRN
jgi:hypothetical protein